MTFEDLAYAMGGLVMVIIFYLLPWLIAAGRNNRNRSGILILNLLTGWTLIGWIASFICACVDPKGE